MTCCFTANRIRILLAALWISALAGGCTGTWGSLKTSSELNLGLEDRSIDPSLAYYYCGRSNLPYAVVGIDRAYTFTSKFWFEIDSMEEVFHKIAHLANLERGQYRRYAREILAPDGRVVGTYFSYYHATPVLVDEAAKTVRVSNPYTPSRCCRKF